MTRPSCRRPLLTAGALALGLGLSAAGSAWGQDDPIAALLDKTAPPSSPPAAPSSGPAAAPPVAPTTEPGSAATPPTVTAPSTPPPPAPPPASLPSSETTPSTAPASPPPPQAEVTRTPEAPRPTPTPYAPTPLSPAPSRPPPALSGPTRIEETGRSPDGPPSPTDLYFESRVRQSFAAAQGLQGPMDGRWVVRAGPIEVYDLQLVDKNQGSVEGAWRDPRRRGATDASGFIDSIQRTGGELVVRFQTHAGDDPVQLSLRQAGDAWTGELVERGERRPVTVRRN